jgi:hypothetical protein
MFFPRAGGDDQPEPGAQQSSGWLKDPTASTLKLFLLRFHDEEFFQRARF